MSSRNSFIVVLALGALLGPAAALGGTVSEAVAGASRGAVSGSTPGSRGPGQYRYPTLRKVDDGPLPEGVKAVSAMAPYTSGDCSVCHQFSDPKKPGPVRKAGNALCYGCRSEE